MRNTKSLQYFIVCPFLWGMVIALTACVGNTPSPSIDSEPLSNQSQLKNSKVDSPKKNTSETSAGYFSSSALDNYRLATPENVPTTEPVQQSSIDVVPVKEPDEKKQAPVDPYTAFPSLAEGVFAYADALHKAGFADSAIAYLERFRIIKPLWAQWESKTDSMLHEYKKLEIEKVKQFEPIILEIQNMNRAHASYSMVAETTDSLIAQNPGDSLVMWAFTQKQIAYSNTLSKAQKEYAQIKSLADDQAKFEEAKKKSIEFQMRYRDFEDTLHIQALIDYIAELYAQNDPAAAKYWEKNDPAKALAQADAMLAADKFNDAKIILNKLKSSNLRKEANARLQMLADAYCNKQRKETSQIFAKAQKQKDDIKKRDLLKQAIIPLEKCLTEYPMNSQHKKVQENMEFLKKELSK